MPELIHIKEPELLFNLDQPMLDPRDGLSLFGPLDKAKPEGIRWAVIGPKESIARMKRWVEKIQQPIISGKNLTARPPFPGFEDIFNTVWSPEPVLVREIPEEELREYAYGSDKYQRVYRTVYMYSDGIKSALRAEHITADVWFVVIPEYIYQNCRPRSTIASNLKVATDVRMTTKTAKLLQEQPSLVFPEDNRLAEQYLYEVDFHNQLKARLLKGQVPTQIVRETTIAPGDFPDKLGRPIRKLDVESAIAWNLSSATFYKAGGRPWKLGAAREGVCYLGIVFKRDERERDPRTACCGAQMFLDSGDGVVFRGAVGPWYRGKPGLFHLNYDSAKEVVRMCIDEYSRRNEDMPPKELFIHGQVTFSNEEWAGFQDGVGENTKVVGVRIRNFSGFKLYRMGSHPIPRGIAYIVNDGKGYLWTKGMIPRLRTYPGREVPNPILVDVCRGEADIHVVMADILALTKLNYNTCNYADGLPVTLKFANAVGNILTAGPARKLDVSPLPFKYYI
ncbi:hypothetical protein ACFL6S_00655 [Candidatus Poribacteria bacterium]